TRDWSSDVCSSDLGSRTRVGDWDDRVALLPCVRPEARLLSYWCDGSDGRRRVERVDVQETPAGHRAHTVDHSDHLGARACRSSTVAPSVRKNSRSILLSRTANAMTAPAEFKNFIAGDWVAPSTGEYFENRNPADWND